MMKDEGWRMNESGGWGAVRAEASVEVVAEISYGYSYDQAIALLH